VIRFDRNDVHAKLPTVFPRQARELLAIQYQQLRNWRRLLSSIGRRRSGQGVFDFSELLALAVIRRLVVDLGVRVGLLAPVAQDLAEMCASVSLEDALNLRIEFEPAAQRVAMTRIDMPAPQTLVALVPLGPIAQSLSSRLTMPPDGPDSLPLFREALMSRPLPPS